MLTNKVALGAFWIFFGRISSHIIALGSTLIVARLLSPEAFGLIALAMSMMAIISAMVDLPVAMALIQLKDPTKQDFDTAFTMSLMPSIESSIKGIHAPRMKPPARLGKWGAEGRTVNGFRA